MIQRAWPQDSMGWFMAVPRYDEMEEHYKVKTTNNYKNHITTLTVSFVQPKIKCSNLPS